MTFSLAAVANLCSLGHLQIFGCLGANAVIGLCEGVVYVGEKILEVELLFRVIVEVAGEVLVDKILIFG